MHAPSLHTMNFLAFYIWVHIKQHSPRNGEPFTTTPEFVNCLAWTTTSVGSPLKPESEFSIS